jgi:hypothetical protein
MEVIIVAAGEEQLQVESTPLHKESSLRQETFFSTPVRHGTGERFVGKGERLLKKTQQAGHPKSAAAGKKGSVHRRWWMIVLKYKTLALSIIHMRIIWMKKIKNRRGVDTRRALQ